MKYITGQFASAKVFTDNIEETALEQINILCDQPFSEGSEIRIMPDVHAGAGCTIGTTMTITGKIVPNMVGVDIGCGMLVVELYDRDIDLRKLDSVIHKFVPCGFAIHQKVPFSMSNLNELHCIGDLLDVSGQDQIDNRFQRSLGTLGGGNHFIEVDEDEKGIKYLVIHTGSRNLGKQVADHYQNIAIEDCSGNGIPDELCYLSGQHMLDYLDDMRICQEYAQKNRFRIAEIIADKMDFRAVVKPWESVHNYLDLDAFILRKGAISARQGEKVIIPLNMRDGCILGIGKGNKDWNYSAPHGAGRTMSRSKAKKMIGLEEFTASMSGIYTTCVNESTIDESAFAYKPSQEIIDAIGDTVEITKIIKPIYNFKATESAKKRR